MICTQRDSYVESYQERHPCWIVTLSSGLAVFQDDCRPGITSSNAWERLYNYCHDTDDYITAMTIRFRSNVHAIPSSADGYYFSKGVRGGLTFAKTIQLFFVGILNQGVLKVTCWRVPEMVPEFTEERDPSKAGICLISKDILRI